MVDRALWSSHTFLVPLRDDDNIHTVLLVTNVSRLPSLPNSSLTYSVSSVATIDLGSSGCHRMVFTV